MKEELGFYDLSGDEQSPDDSVWLRVRFQADFLQFGFSPDGRTWTAIGPALDSSRLSDEWNGKLGFTGTMVGMAAVDLAGGGFHADFAHLDYRPL
jgi:xylan 1,4-beta-xylosidase